MLFILSIMILPLNNCIAQSFFNIEQKREIANSAKESLDLLSDEAKAERILSRELFTEYKLAKSYFIKLARIEALSDREVKILMGNVEKSWNKINRMMTRTGISSNCANIDADRRRCQRLCQRDTGHRFRCGCVVLAIARGIRCIL